MAVAVLDHLARPAAALAVTFAVGTADTQRLVAALTEAAQNVRGQFFGMV